MTPIPFTHYGTDKATTFRYGVHVNPLPFRQLSLRAFMLALVSIAALCGGALAHPPSDATMTYDQNTGDLLVTIIHQIDDSTNHYVKRVTVLQGNTVLIDKSYTSQPDRSSFTYRYPLPQLKGSSGELKVNAQCSIIGSRSGTLMLVGTGTPALLVSSVPGSPSSASPATDAQEPTKSPVGALAAITALGFMALFIRR